MPMTIVDADIDNLRKAARTGRVRSTETLELVQAIETLEPGKAKALIPDEGETVGRLRSKLSYAARSADTKIRIVTDENRVMFALRSGAAGGKTRGGATARRDTVQEKALELARGGKRSITAEDVLDALDKEGVTFDVARPATMVGAVLRAMPEFERVGRNEFRYRGS